MSCSSVSQPGELVATERREYPLDWITDRIAIGNIEDAMDTDGLRAAGISGVLCLNGFPHEPKRKGFAWLNVNLIDGPGNSIDDLRAALRGLGELCRAHKVMVHCMEGLSRSAFVVACYLAQELSIPIDTAIEEVTRRRNRAQIDKGLLMLLENGWEPTGIDVKSAVTEGDVRDDETELEIRWADADIGRALPKDLVDGETGC